MLMNPDKTTFSKLVVIGTSWGGIDALKALLGRLNAPFTFALVVVIHQERHKKSHLSTIFARMVPFPVLEAEDKQQILPGNMYISTPNYHLLVEQDGTLSHTIDSAVNFCRPSVDVLFQTAADAFGDRVIAIVLTGANQDGAEGAKWIQQRGGKVYVQDPKEAEAKVMPLATIAKIDVDLIGNLDTLALTLNNLERKT